VIDRILGDGSCGVSLCTQPCAEGQLLCRRHWFKVPAELREDVNIAWRRYRMNQINLGELRAVQNAAIEAVK
jgi:hypothetical protein